MTGGAILQPPATAQPAAARLAADGVKVLVGFPIRVASYTDRDPVDFTQPWTQ